jgi:hypothetical protein
MHEPSSAFCRNARSRLRKMSYELHTNQDVQNRSYYSSKHMTAVTK